MKPKLLFLFPDAWDATAVDAVPGIGLEHDVVREGFDMFRFPENASSCSSTHAASSPRSSAAIAKAAWSAVLSTNEQYGALLAATVARELGLRGTEPAAIVRAQHKFYARQALAAALPEANPDFALLPYAFERPTWRRSNQGSRIRLHQAREAAYSVLARRIDDAQALQRHPAFGVWEAHLIRRLLRPFADLMREHGQFGVNPLHSANGWQRATRMLRSSPSSSAAAAVHAKPSGSAANATRSSTSEAIHARTSSGDSPTCAGTCASTPQGIVIPIRNCMPLPPSSAASAQ